MKETKPKETHQSPMNLYVLHDSVSEKTGPTFENANHATAVRSVQSMKIQTPNDYTLYHIGVVTGTAINDVKIEKVDWHTAPKPKLNLQG